MSNVQRRVKNIYKIPQLDMMEDANQIPPNDPRSPSANISRTPVDRDTYQLPNVQTRNVIPINSTR